MNDDTQPGSPFKTGTHKRRTQETPIIDPATEDQYPLGVSGPGCLTWLFLGILGIIFAIVIVILAGTAGWAKGQRNADETATAVQATEIQQQIEHIATEVAGDDTVYAPIRVATRLAFLETLTPGVPAVPELRLTATAFYLNSQPTETPTPTATEEVTSTAEQTPEATEEAVYVPNPDGSYDLDAMLDAAQLHIRFGEYEDAYETLDAIIRIDPDFQPTTIRALMSEVLTTQASQLYRTANDTDLAEAIRLTDLAEEYGSIGELDYERAVAVLYLDIQRTVQTGAHAVAINLLTTMLTRYQAEYRTANFRQMLFNEYVIYGDAFALEGNYCQAVVQYGLALSVFNNEAVSTKRDDAQFQCDNPTPTSEPTTESG